MAFTVFSRSRRGRLLLVLPVFLILFAAAAWLGWPVAAHAQTQDDGDIKPCASCHDDEADAWMVSPHATTLDPESGQPIAVCEACHGDYVRGHPDEALAPLRVDSSSCKECHAATFKQWEESIHGAEGVQCISCHLPHSQQMRLTDEGQCKACHNESLTDPLHTAHWQSDATCTDCHMAVTEGGVALAAADPTMAALAVPNHDFVTVSADNCLECHREDVSTERAAPNAQEIANRTAAERAPVLAANLESARANNRSLSILSVANLGFGIGLGGILGIVFMVVIIRLSNRER